jgi:hypothetical protein
MDKIDVASDQKQAEFNGMYLLKETGNTDYDIPRYQGLSQLKIAIAPDDSEYKELRTEIAEERKIKEKVLPAAEKITNICDEQIKRSQGILIEAQGIVMRKLDPVDDNKTDIQQLKQDQKEREIRAILGAMEEGPRRKTISDALQKDDASLLLAWLNSPVPQPDHEQLAEIKQQYDEYRAKTTCQRDYEILISNRAFAERVLVACNLAKSSISDWVNGYWRQVSSPVQKKILQDARNAEILQRCGCRII